MTGERVSPGGARIFDGRGLVEPFGIAGHYLLTESEQETELAGINGDSMSAVCYGSGYFYCESGDTYGIYRVNPETGDAPWMRLWRRLRSRCSSIWRNNPDGIRAELQ